MVRPLVLAALVLLGLVACAPPCQNQLIIETPAGAPQPLYVCCGPGGCVAVDNAADCAAGSYLYNCEAGESTTIDGKPAVVCHD